MSAVVKALSMPVGLLLLEIHLFDMVTCEVKLFRNYFCLRRHPFEIILFWRVKTCLKLFQNYFRGF